MLYFTHLIKQNREYLKIQYFLPTSINQLLSFSIFHNINQKNQIKQYLSNERVTATPLGSNIQFCASDQRTRMIDMQPIYFKNGTNAGHAGMQSLTIAGLAQS